MFSLTYLLLLLISEVLTLKGQSITASPKAGRYFNPGSQSVLRLSVWACLQSSTVGWGEQHEDNA